MYPEEENEHSILINTALTAMATGSSQCLTLVAMLEVATLALEPGLPLHVHLLYYGSLKNINPITRPHSVLQNNWTICTYMYVSAK